MTNEDIKLKIQTLADPKVAKFASSLIPNSGIILGVRLPILRGIAKEIVKNSPDIFLQNATDDCLEETMLQAMVIGLLKTDFETLWGYIANFIPKITNWSICDTFCCGLKNTSKFKPIMWSKILPYLKSDKEFEVRFATIMILSYFITEDKIDEILNLIPTINHDGYYVKMGVAWLISICFIHFPEKTLKTLKEKNLDTFTHNKSIQKIIDSRRVDKETKIKLKLLKK